MFIDAEVRESGIFGRGLFCRAPVRRGTIVCSFTADARIITEPQYLDGIRANQYRIVRTGTRYAGRYFTVSDDTESDLNFFNHSFEPNLLCHCGLVLALRDIEAGSELTIDYRTLTDGTDIGVYEDATTGRPIRGFSARQTMLLTARKLIDLLESLEDDWEG